VLASSAVISVDHAGHSNMHNICMQWVTACGTCKIAAYRTVRVRIHLKPSSIRFLIHNQRSQCHRTSYMVIHYMHHLQEWSLLLYIMMLFFTGWRYWDGALAQLLLGHWFLLFPSHSASCLLSHSLSLIHILPFTVSSNRVLLV